MDIEKFDFDPEYSSRPHYYTRYYVDGFRSLQHFSLKLEEGINVFVGPNGAGKTNFIDLLDFISVFLIRGLSGAISDAGGISRVFSQETLKNRMPRVQLEVSGLADMGSALDEHQKRSLFRYDYALDIRYSKVHSAVYVASEKIKFKSLFWDDLAVYVNSTVGTLGVRRRSAAEDFKAETEIGARLLTNGAKNPLRYRGRRRRGIGSQVDPALEPLELPDVGHDQSILSNRGYLLAFDAVRESLSRGRSFNLQPGFAREPSEITASPTISRDGSGLSATLYHLGQARKGRAAAHSLFRRFKNDDLETIISWTKLVLPELSDIETIADPHTGKYLSSLIVSYKDESLRIPLQSASDGTLKWLSFVCLIVSGGGARSIEEPENFLHPKMQRMLVSLVRESMESDHPGHFIISTHSESLINQCSPAELVLFSFKKGRTIAARLQSPDKVEEQINDTGFGLGYYYAANAVS